MVFHIEQKRCVAVETFFDRKILGKPLYIGRVQDIHGHGCLRYRVGSGWPHRLLSEPYGEIKLAAPV